MQSGVAQAIGSTLTQARQAPQASNCERPFQTAELRGCLPVPTSPSHRRHRNDEHPLPGSLDASAILATTRTDAKLPTASRALLAFAVDLPGALGRRRRQGLSIARSSPTPKPDQYAGGRGARPQGLCIGRRWCTSWCRRGVAIPVCTLPLPQRWLRPSQYNQAVGRVREFGAGTAIDVR